MLIKVTVKPGSSKGPAVEERNGELLVYLHERAHDGEANVALVRLLAKYYGVAKSRVAIRSGARSRQKIVEIR